ncbi:MAG: SDR family NAD(P)-dependent oxidoreductase [Pseudomonadales bacterium]|nr:SDR family NAD(P)-dependent oxidoreductase [Pseudomonadales bacterium]
MASHTAVILGVGPLEGLGGTLCLHAAREGLHVIVAGRTAGKLEAVTKRIAADGGEATAIVTNATDEQQVCELVRQAESIGSLDFAIYNAGNNYNGDFLEMEADFFERAWRIGTFGGFLFAREALKVMTPRERGTLLFTGASASMRGKPGFAPFTAAKAGLRAMAQSLAREFQPKGIHVGHVVIDGGIDGEKIRKHAPDFASRVGEDGLIGLDGIAEAYMYLYRQPKNAWTHELDLRTFKENF